MAHIYVSPKVTIRRVKEVSSNSQQDIFPVVDEHNRYRGFIRATDLAEYDDERTVDEVLDECEEYETRNISVFLDAELEQARKVLTANKINIVPVINYAGEYMGTLDQAST